MITPIIIISIFLILMIVSIIADFKIKIKNHFIPLYCIFCLIGALICIFCGFAGTKDDVLNIFFSTDNINPLKILIIFISCTSISVLLDKIGFFSYVAGLVLKNSKANQTKLFFSFSAIIAVLTIFTSNDILILTFTPFICYFSKCAKINPIPYIVSEFVCANIWSMFFIIGNPTNIYICTTFGITFFEYAIKMFLPTISCGIISTILVYLIFRKQLKQKIEVKEIEIIRPNKYLLIIGLIGLSSMVCLMSISNYIGIELWYIPLICSIFTYISTIVCIILKKENFNIILTSLINLPYTLIPFLLSMSVYIAVLNNIGLIDIFANFLNDQNIFVIGFISFLFGNILNNIPMTMMFTSTLTSMTANYSIVSAVVASSNICALFTPIGSLAGIMFIKILKQSKIEFSFKHFIKYGTLISFPIITTALLIISLC